MGFGDNRRQKLFFLFGKKYKWQLKGVLMREDTRKRLSMLAVAFSTGKRREKRAVSKLRLNHLG